MSKDFIQDVKDFARVAESMNVKTHSRLEVNELCRRLIDEEACETTVDLEKYKISGSLEHLMGAVDGAIDTIYVCLFFLNQNNIDVQAHWDLVQERNMAKFPGGKAVKNEYGKVVKPEGWFPPDEGHMQLLIDWNSKMRGEFYQGGLIRQYEEKVDTGIQSLPD